MVESSIERHACDKIRRELGVDSLKLNVHNNVGYPDRLFFTPGTPVFIEFKRPGGTLSRRQEYTIRTLLRRGYEVHVVEDIITAYTIILKRLEKCS